MQVPEYRDRELDPTLEDLFAKASRPERLRVAVLSQRAADDPAVRVPPARAGAVEVLHVAADDSRGPNWARRCLQARYDGEEYALLIDSHLRFVPGWDRIAVTMLEQLRSHCEAPVLTAYLPAYRPGSPRQVARSPYKIYPYGRQGGVLTRLTSFPLSGWERLEAPIPAEYLSLHFALAPGAIVAEVPHDPEIYFFGDEVAYGARAFTHGWDLFHPHRVVGWHAYDRASRTPHWDDHPEWGDLHRSTLGRLHGLFTGDPVLDQWRGRVRSMGDYERHIMTRLVQPSTA
ncbi:GlcNAc-transferase family protein [Nocardioides sp. MAHUQ-72]|uniref:GlcNAc-transferase family protein n=1 Tax=unclassified Nocardioides TaxID=2615069 RepID=UPI0036088516